MTETKTEPTPEEVDRALTTSDEEPGFEYRVRLVMRVAATEGDDPATAVVDFIEQMVEKGLRTWAYMVENPKTGKLIGYYDGYGNELEIDATGTTPEAAAEIENVDLPEDDAALEALAQSLNDGE